MNAFFTPGWAEFRIPGRAAVENIRLHADKGFESKYILNNVTQKDLSFLVLEADKMMEVGHAGAGMRHVM
jgi:hypothetical protein